MSDDLDAQLVRIRQTLVEVAHRFLHGQPGPPLPLDASDFVQQVLLEACLEKLVREYGEEKAIRSLIKHIKYEISHAVRRQAAAKRDRARERPLEAVPEEALSDRQASPVERAERNELLARVAAVLPDLPPAQQEVLHAHFFEGLSLAEIAARRGRSRATITVRFQQGLARLKERLHLSDEP